MSAGDRTLGDKSRAVCPIRVVLEEAMPMLQEVAISFIVIRGPLRHATYNGSISQHVCVRQIIEDCDTEVVSLTQHTMSTTIIQKITCTYLIAFQDRSWERASRQHSRPRVSVWRDVAVHNMKVGDGAYGGMNATQIEGDNKRDGREENESSVDLWLIRNWDLETSSYMHVHILMYK